MIKKKKRKQNFTPMLRDSCPRNSDTIAIFTVVGEKKNLIIKSRYNPITDLHKTMFILTGDGII